MRKRRLLSVLGLIFLLSGGFLYYYEQNPQVYNVLAQSGLNLNFLDAWGNWEKEMECGTFFTLVDQTGQELDQISRYVFIGDQFILEDNRHYQVIKIERENYKAIAELVSTESLSGYEVTDHLPVVTQKEQGKIGIYMTHTDESYLPTDGASSKLGNGGILKVGNVFANNLIKEKLNAFISFNIHCPHDANAYHRSRKTAVQLLKNNPLALVDVHRDGVPDPDFYNIKLKGEPATKIRLVVGRQNPHVEANLAFAKNIKAYFDQTSPGLIKGIFMGKGNYNQDLGPRTILIEVGTYTNSRFAAQRGVAHFAEGMPQVIAAITGSEQVPGAKKGGVLKAIFGILFFLIGGGALFLWVSTGSWPQAWTRFRKLGQEFTNWTGSRKNPVKLGRKNSEEESDG